MSYIQTIPTLTDIQADAKTNLSYPKQTWPHSPEAQSPTGSSTAPTTPTEMLSAGASPELSKSMVCTASSGTAPKCTFPKTEISSGSVSIEFPLETLQELQEHIIQSRRNLEATKYPYESLSSYFSSLTLEQKTAVEILIKGRLQFNAAWSKIVSEAFKYFSEKYLQSVWTENGWDLRAWGGEGWEYEEPEGVGEVPKRLSELQAKMYRLDPENEDPADTLQHFVVELAAIEVCARNGPVIDSERGWVWSRKMSVFDEGKDKAQKEWAKVEAEWAEKEASIGLKVVF